jgi:pantoate kinase
LVPSKFPRGAGKGAAALGALGAASGVAANVGYKKKKK